MEITDDLVRHQLRDRWVEVARIEAEEARTATPEQRWRQFVAILLMAQGLGLDQWQQDEAGIEAVRQRWAILRERLA